MQWGQGNDNGDTDMASTRTLKRYVGFAPFTPANTVVNGPTIAGFGLTPAMPTNYVVHTCYIVIMGTPASTTPAETDALFCGVGTIADTGIYGGAVGQGTDILGKTNRQVFPLNKPGFHGAESTLLWLNARLLPDTDGSLEQIAGLDGVKFVMEYTDATAE